MDDLLEFLSYAEYSRDNMVANYKWNLFKRIHKRGKEVKNDVSIEVEYMTLLERDREKIEEGREEGKVELLIKQLIKKFKAVPNEYSDKLKSLSEENIALIAMEIFYMESIEDLKKYF